MLRRILFMVVLASVIYGCATVPKESVELSSLVGEMISSAKVSHVNMVNRHFDYLRSNVEYFAFHDYKEKFLANLQKLKKDKDPTFVSLSFDEYDRAITRIQEKRDKWLEEVEKNRQAVLYALEEHYAVLTQANTEVTSFLRSATNISETHAALLQRFGPSIGVSGTKIKEVEDKILEGTNKVRSVMESAIESIK